MSKIVNIKAREILDSRSNPTVEVELTTETTTVISAVPSGASTGEHEALELRDNDPDRFFGKGVLKAIGNIKEKISPVIVGKEADLNSIDKILIDLDGTEHKSNLGANSLLPISLCVLKAQAIENRLSLFEFVGKLFANNTFKLPTPMFNVINGASHADNNLKVQEFMIVPQSNTAFAKKYQIGSEAFNLIKKSLKNRGLNTAIGDEGGFSPSLPNDEEALAILSSIKGVKIGLDFAGIVPDEFDLADIANKYPIMSYEDPADEDDFGAWTKITSELGEKVYIVADDLVVTNKNRLSEAIKNKSANAVIVKPNQIGTITETLEFAKLAKQNNYAVIMSHRSGETEDTAIADIAVGIGAEFMKSGAPSRGERISKYNRLLRIEERINSTNE